MTSIFIILGGKLMARLTKLFNGFRNFGDGTNLLSGSYYERQNAVEKGGD